MAPATSRSSLEQRQWPLLASLLERVGRDNPFYRDRWQACGIRPEVGSIAEFKTRFPFTRKQDLVIDQAAHPPYGSNLTFPIDHYTRCHGTSGSTGHPLRWLDTPQSWQWMLDNWRRVYLAAGVTRSDRVFFAFSFGPFLGFWTAFEAALQLGCLCLPGGGLTTVARLRSILDQQATVLCCTPTYALHLGATAHAEHLDLAASPVRRILVAGEPGGSIPATRNAIESAWPGARVFDHHGMTEVGPVSYPCPAQPGVLHVIEEGYLAEIVDPRTTQPSPDHAIGELVLTTLGRVGSPLIRYRTGDLVRARPIASPCPCGSVDLALDGGILGRADDMVVIRGVNVFPSAVEEVIRDVGGIAEYRAEVHAEGALRELRIEIEPVPASSSATAPADLARRLEHAFQSRLALRVPVRILEPGTLPRFEMKARRWIRTAEPASAPRGG
ncbi:MAG: AMP-binding protein [Verrucomicrobiae bacterium]|nr:AMP-binding protein [Verrucomicrobiae bacterium]